MLCRCVPDSATGWLLALLLVAGLQQMAQACVIEAKAWLAPILIERAWSHSIANGGRPVKPWAWADTWPVGRLQVPGLGVDLIVLAGDSGNALAFGPGHARFSAALGGAGLAVIAGHRDTHFRFLESLPPDARLALQLPDGEWQSFRVQGSRIVDSRHERLQREVDASGLLLVTCYPFDSVFPGGHLRYVLSAVPIA